MSEVARSPTSPATAFDVFVSWWEGELDHATLHARLNQQVDPTDVKTAITTG